MAGPHDRVEPLVPSPFPETDGEGLGSTLNPSPRTQDELVERTLDEGRNFEAPAGGAEAQALEGAIQAEAGALVREGADLDPTLLVQPGTGGAGNAGPTAGDIGGANAAGFGASLGAGRAAAPGTPPAGTDQDAANEQQAERLNQARAQSGEAAAPDQTRAEGDFGSINETEGL